MTKKDYIAIANAIKGERGCHSDPACIETCDSLADAIAYEFEKDSARFDRARFLKACGVQS